MSRRVRLVVALLAFVASTFGLSACSRDTFEERFFSQLLIAIDIGLDDSDSVAAVSGTGGGPTPTTLQYFLEGTDVGEEVAQGLTNAGFTADDSLNQIWEREEDGLEQEVILSPFSSGESFAIERGTSDERYVASEDGIRVTIA